MKNHIGLGELSDFLQSTHIKLKLTFLNKLLKSSAKSCSPHRNEKFAEKIGCPLNKNKKTATTIYGWMRGYRTIPLSKITKILSFSSYSWKDIEKNLISIKSGIRKGEICPKFPIKIDYKLGVIIGHILGDGSIEKRFHSVFYSNSDVDLLKEFSKYMIDIFGIRPRIWVQEKRSFNEKTKWMKRVNNLDRIPKKHNVGLFYPKICSDILYAISGKFAEGKNKKITKEIREFNKDFKKGVIRSFFDDEGSVNSNSHIIRFHQDRIDILEDIKNILKEFNINSNIVRFYNKRNKLRYYFNITGFREYYNLYYKIGCTSIKKKREFELLINKVKNSKYFKKKYAL
ncbi:MAG TPA: LAGLIDADG family homing endonuclease [Candidatus Paceibacterota bacterium]|nr:LAGLIDADG family homing endonuclease [Candidatus Paceibacterota bacterium]